MRKIRNKTVPKDRIQISKKETWHLQSSLMGYFSLIVLMYLKDYTDTS